MVVIRIFNRRHRADQLRVFIALAAFIRTWPTYFQHNFILLQHNSNTIKAISRRIQRLIEFYSIFIKAENSTSSLFNDSFSFSPPFMFTTTTTSDINLIATNCRWWMITESGNSILTDATIGKSPSRLPWKWPLESLHSKQFDSLEFTIKKQKKGILGLHIFSRSLSRRRTRKVDCMYSFVCCRHQ